VWSPLAFSSRAREKKELPSSQKFRCHARRQLGAGFGFTSAQPAKSCLAPRTGDPLGVSRVVAGFENPLLIGIDYASKELLRLCSL
jgi:hypothetical protein